VGILVRKQKGIFVFTGIAKLAVIGFIVALASAYISTIWAVYMDSFVNSVVIVGFVSAFLTLVSFISYFYFIPLIERTDKSKIYSFSLLAIAILYLLFAINTKFYIFIILAFIVTIMYTLRTTSFGIIVKDYSAKKQLSRNEGVMYTFFNLSFVIGPLIAGYVAEKFGINIVFTLSAIFVFLAFFVFRISSIKDKNVKKKTDGSLVKNFFDFFKSKERVLAYILGGGVNLWWILIYLFIPLFIIRNNLHELWIGYFLFAVAVPLIFLEFIFAKLAGKIGFKKMFKIGFLIPCIFAVSCFFFSNVYIILSLLVLASIGLAMLEPTTEAYFFDILKGKEELRFYGPYNTTMDVNNFIGKIIASTLLIFLPFRYIFLIFAGFMFIMFLISFRIRDVVERKR